MDPMFMKEYSRITQDMYVYEYIKKINMYVRIAICCFYDECE